MKSLTKLFKGAGLLNILGMSVAFAAIYVILVQVNYEWTFNKGIKDGDRILPSHTRACIQKANSHKTCADHIRKQFFSNRLR